MNRKCAVSVAAVCAKLRIGRVIIIQQTVSFFIQRGLSQIAELAEYLFAAHSNFRRTRPRHFGIRCIQRVKHRRTACFFDAETRRSPVINSLIALHIRAVPLVFRQRFITRRRTPCFGERRIARLIERQIFKYVVRREHFFQVAFHVVSHIHFIADFAVCRHGNSAQRALTRRQLDRFVIVIQRRFRRRLSSVNGVIDRDNRRRVLVRLIARTQADFRRFFVLTGSIVGFRCRRRRNNNRVIRRNLFARRSVFCKANGLNGHFPLSDVQARPRRINQARFRWICAIRGIINGFALRNGDGHINFFTISSGGFRQRRRSRRIFAQHHVKFLRSSLFRRHLHQCQRFGVIAFILINLDEISIRIRI